VKDKWGVHGPQGVSGVLVRKMGKKSLVKRFSKSKSLTADNGFRAGGQENLEAPSEQTTEQGGDKPDYQVWERALF